MMKKTNLSFNLKDKEIKYNLLKYILKTVTGVLAVFGVLALLIMFNLIRLIGQNQKISVVSIPQNAIISLNLNPSFPETPKDGLLSVDNAQMTYFELIKNINIAMLDDNVKALVANINVTGLGLAQIQNLRTTIQTFRNQGKQAYLFSSDMGTLGQGTDEYYLATAFDKIYMQPHSELGITGIEIEVPFAKKALEKLGIKAEFYTRYEYKNAMASLTDSTFPQPFKQQMMALGEKIYTVLKNEIAQSRGIDADHLEKLINQAPLSAEEALENNLIDGLIYYSDFQQQLEKQYQGKIITLEDYASNYIQKEKHQPAIAYLALEGTIIESGNADMDITGELTVSAANVIKNIQEIAENDDVKALIVRVNSPGGSYIAADAVRHELEKLKKEKNLPVIVSMGNYAASGGYFIALAGDELFAEPLTLTGSIGVLGGKIVAQELWQKLGINWESVSFGTNAGIDSINHTFTPTEKAAFNKSLDNIYKDFTAKVSSARNITPEQLDKLARGRVWLGEDAVKNGLVDRIGDIDAALTVAKIKGKIASNQKFNILTYPKAKTFAEKINDFLRRPRQISINRLATKIGLDINTINMLQQLRHDCIMEPFTIYK